MFRSRDDDEPLEKCAFNDSAFTSFPDFADVFKHLCFSYRAQCCVARLNKGACDALMFSMYLRAVFFFSFCVVLFSDG